MYDFRAVSPAIAAALALGLPDESRVKRGASGQRYSFGERLMMLIYDRVNWLCWTKTKACQRGGDPPPPLEEQLRQNMERAEEQRLMGFDDPDELLRYLGHGGEKNG